MPVTVGFARAVTGGDDIVDVIEDVLQDAADLVEEATWDAAIAQRDRMRQVASEHPRWASMAPHIDMWANDEGNVTYGVRAKALQHQAYEAEYGDATHPPDSIIRMGLHSAVTDMRPNPRIACVPLAPLWEMMAMPPRKPIAATGVTGSVTCAAMVSVPANSRRHSVNLCMSAA